MQIYRNNFAYEEEESKSFEPNRQQLGKDYEIELIELKDIIQRYFFYLLKFKINRKEKENANLIEKLFEREEYCNYLTDLNEAKRLSEQLEEEHLLKKKEEENSKPTWTICFEEIDFNDLLPFYKWSHLFHRKCLSPYITGKIKSKNQANNISKFMFTNELNFLLQLAQNET